MTNVTDTHSHSTWSDTETLECVSVIPEALNTATFTFRAFTDGLFDYLPGQFLTLELPLPSGTVLRTYTISSSPSRPRSLSITVKAQKDSIGSRWMLDHLIPGVEIKALAQRGTSATLTIKQRSTCLFLRGLALHRLCR